MFTQIKNNPTIMQCGNPLSILLFFRDSTAVVISVFAVRILIVGPEHKSWACLNKAGYNQGDD